MSRPPPRRRCKPSMVTSRHLPRSLAIADDLRRSPRWLSEQQAPSSSPSLCMRWLGRGFESVSIGSWNWFWIIINGSCMSFEGLILFLQCKGCESQDLLTLVNCRTSIKCLSKMFFLQSIEDRIASGLLLVTGVPCALALGSRYIPQPTEDLSAAYCDGLRISRLRIEMVEIFHYNFFNSYSE